MAKDGNKGGEEKKGKTEEMAEGKHLALQPAVQSSSG
jgi:hypothetical protein